MPNVFVRVAPTNISKRPASRNNRIFNIPVHIAEAENRGGIILAMVHAMNASGVSKQKRMPKQPSRHRPRNSACLIDGRRDMPTTTKQRCPKCGSEKWFTYKGALKEDPTHPGDDAYKRQKITKSCHDCKHVVVIYLYISDVF